MKPVAGVLGSAGDDESFVAPPQTHSPSVDSPRSQWNETTSKLGESSTLPRSPTVPRPSRNSGKWREKPGTAAPDKRPGGGVNESVRPEETDDWAAESRRLAASKPRSFHHENHTVPGISGASGSGTVFSSLSQENGRGRTPLSFRNRNTSKTSSTTREPHTTAHSSSMSWRERAKSGLVDKTPENVRGPRLTRAPSERRGSRSGSLSEGHQSPDDDGESKKKVDWMRYDA